MKTILLKDQLHNSLCSKLKLKNVPSSTRAIKHASENIVCLIQVSFSAYTWYKNRAHIADLIHITLHILMCCSTLLDIINSSEYLNLTMLWTKIKNKKWGGPKAHSFSKKSKKQENEFRAGTISGARGNRSHPLHWKFLQPSPFISISVAS